MQKLLFIVNPNSGVGKQKVIEKSAEKHIDSSRFSVDFSYTEGPKHAIEISKNASEKYDIVAAVGGDGTVNEVSAGLVDTSTTLAVIPTGSGNGFARHMNIPCNVKSAIKLINNGNLTTVDSVEMNGMPFVNVSGIGFDAEISHLFANYGKRGPLSYAQIISQEFSKYKPIEYDIIVDGVEFRFPAFLISFANSSQWGNNVYISPKASTDDGKLDVCILSPFKNIEVAQIVTSMLAGQTHKMKQMNVLHAKELIVKNHFHNINAHLDGEPVHFTEDIHIVMKPASLKVIRGDDNIFQQLQKAGKRNKKLISAFMKDDKRMLRAI